MKFFLFFLAICLMLGIFMRNESQRKRVGLMLIVSVFVAATYYFVFAVV